MSLEALGEIKHLGFALYGFAPSVCPISELYQWALDWFDRLGCVPDLGDVDVGGKSRGHYRSFRGLDRKVRAAGFSGVSKWSLLDIPNELFNDSDGDLYGQEMGVSYATSIYTRSLVFHTRESVVANRMDEFLEAARQACNLLRPTYGIGYRRKYRYDPLLFGLGMGRGDNDPVEFNSDYWRMLNRLEMYTLLRGVYPWNFLTSTQLNVGVGNSCLKDWILASPGRGGLRPLTDQVTLWTVPEQAIAVVQNDLLQAGVVLDHNRDIVPKMREYHVDADTVIESLKTGNPLAHRPPPRGISEEEMLGRVLGAFGAPESEVFKVEQSGELRELSDAEVQRAKKTTKKKPGTSRKKKS